MIQRFALAFIVVLSARVVSAGITIGKNWVVPPPDTKDEPKINDEQKQSSTPAWHKLTSNVNYRITAILDVNGGASATPVFETNGAKFDDSSTDSVKTPGYSVPIDVLTLQDPQTKVWRQRISYYGMQVDYNNNGEGYKLLSTPYTGQRRTAERLHDPKKMMCMFIGGNSTVDKQKEPYLNFFPTLEQMKMYTLGKLVTTEPGIPYRVASLEAAHGSFNETDFRIVRSAKRYCGIRNTCQTSNFSCLFDRYHHIISR